MDAQKHPQEGSGYGYSYGGGYSGYSAAGYGYGEGGGSPGGQIQRTFQDYLLILRERIWYVVVVFLVVFSSALVYTLSQTKIYQSSAVVQILRSDPIVMTGTTPVVPSEIRDAQDLNTQMKLLESQAIVAKVAERITGDDLRAFLAPFDRSTADSAFVQGQLARNRRVVPQRLTLMVNVGYVHPDRFVAAKVANLFSEAYIEYNQRQRIDDITNAHNELKLSVDDQRKKVEQMASVLQDFKEQKKMPSFDQRKDIINETLKSLNESYNQTQRTLAAAEIRVNQLKDQRAKGLPLTDLPFIASQQQIGSLMSQRATQEILIATLARKYRAQHPEMIKANNTLLQIQTELTKAVESATAQVDADYQAALRLNQETSEQLNKQKEVSLELDRDGLQYNNLARDLLVNEQMLQNMVTRDRQTLIDSNIITQNSRIVDHAVPSPEGAPIAPNVTVNLGVGLVGGLGLGLAFAFFVAFIDDRVKSSFDIEGVVGLPLIGIIPQIKRMDAADKAQIVVNNADRQVSEAFLTLHSSLRLKDESKNARCILITSTIPGEGKSFTTTNLALTFAAHGEKVIVIDCDLRKPNIHKSFRVENLKGVIDVAAGTASIDDVVIRGQHPNLDILPAGGRAKNPTQILNSKGFEIMISDLRKRYDRIFIDTPPLAAVSDALIILPLVDGSIFTIFFNKVRRKAAQFSAKRLLDANVPNFGAVLNGLNLAVSGYYYAQYYDKSYKDYYVVMAKNEEADDAEPRR